MKKLEEQVTPEIQRALALIINRGYMHAAQLVKATDFLSWIIGEEQLPYIRRAAIDFHAKLIAPSIPGLVATPKPNANGRCFHLELAKGNELIMTFNHKSLFQGHGDLPRDAIFREMLARPLEQMNLFGKEARENFDFGPVFAMLVHQGNEFPKNAELIVPDYANKTIYDRMAINLNVVEQAQTAEEIQALDIEFREFLGQQGGDFGPDRNGE